MAELRRKSGMSYIMSEWGLRHRKRGGVPTYNFTQPEMPENSNSFSGFRIARDAIVEARGGAFTDLRSELEKGTVDSMRPDHTYWDQGFRIARDIKE